jgi:hypothetical protein
MLTLVSLELARAKRRAKPLISCRVNSLQLAQAAMQAAELERAPILITIDATIPTSLPHYPLVAALLAAGRESKSQVALEVVIPCQKQTASWWLDHGALAITLHGTKEQIARGAKAILSEAAAYHAELGVEPIDITSDEEVARLAVSSNATFLRLKPREKVAEMRSYVLAARQPVIAGTMLATPRQSKSLVTAGCAGLTLGEEIQEAFTAGLRTGLRNRSTLDPAQYLGYGATAARELIRATIAYYYD